MNLVRSQAFETGAVILAAGRSSRMGRPKLLLPWGPTSVLGHLIAQWSALGARQVAVVCAPGDQLIGAELDRLGFPAANRITNPAPDRGMFSSIQCAVSWGGWLPALSHYAIVLGDQPHLRHSTLHRLLQFAREHPDRVCQPLFAGRPRHPVLIPKEVFLEVAGSACATLKDFLYSREPGKKDLRSAKQNAEAKGASSPPALSSKGGEGDGPGELSGSKPEASARGILPPDQMAEAKRASSPRPSPPEEERETDSGARPFVGAESGLERREAPKDPALCEIDDPGLELDIDRPEDYRRALRISGYLTSQ